MECALWLDQPGLTSCRRLLIRVNRCLKPKAWVACPVSNDRSWLPLFSPPSHSSLPDLYPGSTAPAQYSASVLHTQVTIPIRSTWTVHSTYCILDAQANKVLDTEPSSGRWEYSTVLSLSSMFHTGYLCCDFRQPLHCFMVIKKSGLLTKATRTEGIPQGRQLWFKSLIITSTFNHSQLVWTTQSLVKCVVSTKVPLFSPHQKSTNSTAGFCNSLSPVPFPLPLF